MLDTIRRLKNWAYTFFLIMFMSGIMVSFTNCSKSGLVFNVGQNDSSSTITPPGNTQLQTIQSPILLRTGGRSYAANLLNQIFGPVGAIPKTNYTFAQYFVTQQINPFGEGCDMYEAAAYAPTGGGATVYDDVDELCNWPNDNSNVGVQETLVPGIVSPGTLREADQIQACQNILAVPSAITTALAQVPGASVNTAPTDATLAGAYNLFYPNQTASSDIVDALTQLTESIPAPITPAAQWQAVLLTLCLAPDWQVL